MGTSIGKSSTSPDPSPAITNTSTTPVTTPRPGPQPKQAEHDPKVEAKNAQASKQHAADRKYEQYAGGKAVKDDLHKKLPATRPPDDGLKPGEEITAKVTDKADSIKDQVERTFEFSKPVTKEQAAAIIFQNGQIPAGAKLVQGAGNQWKVQFQNSAEMKQQVASHYNSHKESVFTPPRQPHDVYFPDKQMFMTWVGGAPKTSTRTGPVREDLNNKMGFKITNHYTLDEGQRKAETLGFKGLGYEVSFDKAMTKDQVMNQLFEKQNIQMGEVRLIPQTPEPATQWKVEVIGEDAATAFKVDASRAFGAAGAYGKESLPTGTPAAVRNQIENHIVPKDAVKHPPDAYVWEQDGYMVYVKTDNKGKDGYYNPEITKMPGDEQGKTWLRYYMKEQGMAPREAWKEFWKDTVEIARMEIGMISGAARMPHYVRVGTPKSSFGDAPAPSPRVNVRGGSSAGDPSVPTRGNIHADAPSGGAKPSKPSAGGGHDVGSGPSNIKAGQKSDIGTASTQPGPPPSPPAPPKGPPPSRPPGGGGGSSSGSSSGGGSTVDSSSGGSSGAARTRSPFGEPMTVRRGDRWYRPYPHAGDNQEYTINTVKGSEKMTGLEYRLRTMEAEEWVNQQYLHPSNARNVTGAGPSQELYRKAAERFGLNEGWQRTNNPILRRIANGK